MASLQKETTPTTPTTTKRNILTTEKLVITKENDKYNIELKTRENELLDTFDKTTITKYIERKASNKLTLNCNTIQSLPQFISRIGKLSYNEGFNLLYNVSKQILFLEENNNYTKPYLELSNIFVINDEDFYLFDFDNIIEIEGDFITIKEQIRNKSFVSPELAILKTIPSRMPKNSWLFSIACIIITSITGYNASSLKSVNPDVLRRTQEYKLMIESFEDTKLYYTLMRCLTKDPYERILLIV